MNSEEKPKKRKRGTQSELEERELLIENLLDVGQTTTMIKKYLVERYQISSRQADRDIQACRQRHLKILEPEQLRQVKAGHLNQLNALLRKAQRDKDTKMVVDLLQLKQRYIEQLVKHVGGLGYEDSYTNRAGKIDISDAIEQFLNEG